MDKYWQKHTWNIQVIVNKEISRLHQRHTAEQDAHRSDSDNVGEQKHGVSLSGA